MFSTRPGRSRGDDLIDGEFEGCSPNSIDDEVLYLWTRLLMDASPHPTSPGARLQKATLLLRNPSKNLSNVRLLMDASHRPWQRRHSVLDSGLRV